MVGPFRDYCEIFNMSRAEQSNLWGRELVQIASLIVNPLRYRGGGGGGGHPRYVFRGRRGLFLRPPQVRDFVKEGYFFVHRYEVLGVKIPLQSTKYTRL